MPLPNRLFGVAFDPPGSPERLDIKLAYLLHLKNSPEAATGFMDPYDFAREAIGGKDRLFRDRSWFGKMEVDSWLSPKPLVEDIPILSSGMVDLFLQSGGCRRHMEKVKVFAEENIFPARPFMIGVDHCSTAGLVMALAEKLPDLNVIVIDSHFDLIDTTDTVPAGEGAYQDGTASFCHCGNFLLTLLEENIISPEHLWVIGVNDEFLRDPANPWLRDARKWLDRGVHLFSKSSLPSRSDGLRPTGPVYLSVDLDIGSLSSVFSARFMNCYGLDRQELLALLSTIRVSIDRAHQKIVGMDIMELDVHFLETANTFPFQDCTPDLFLKAFQLFEE